MFFNINDCVYVKLTPKGRNMLSQVDGLQPIEEDSEGWSKWQLWMLMHTFGEHLYNGCALPFEPTIKINTPHQCP
jgi:hypothetical protein